MSAFNFDLSFVNVSSKGDIYNCKSIKYDIKPDVYIYPSNIKTPDRCDVTKAEMMVEFKWNRGDDPFSTSSSASSFIMSSQQARDTMGKITAYSSAQLGAQWHTHTYQILIIKNYAYLIRWDHEGFIVTEPIFYRESPALIDFFQCYNVAPHAMRSHDKTVSCITSRYLHLITTVRQKLGLPSNA
ncbi:hypothetical protein C8R48DRAFT_597120 [Suillus tomentosus]|nr:hypothetical protein C8R48DRAFT_597120 [Suillus tomentosus]